jgi:transcription-repair coupling factor (superfamily II helicase)
LSKTILSQKFQQSLIHQNLSAAISNSKGKIHLKGALGSSLSFTIASVFKTTNQPFLLIFDNKEEAVYYLNDLEVLLVLKI